MFGKMKQEKQQFQQQLGEIRETFDSLTTKFEDIAEKIEENPTIKQMVIRDKYNAICNVVNAWNEGQISVTLAMTRIKETIENKLRLLDE